MNQWQNNKFWWMDEDLFHVGLLYSATAADREIIINCAPPGDSC